MTPEQQHALASMPTRERECLRLRGQRLTSKESARLLDLAPSTVRTNLRRATDRLGAASAADAAVLLASHEADDPVVSEWLQRLLTTVSAAAVVIDRGRVSPNSEPERYRPPELELGRPPTRAPAPDDGSGPLDADPPYGGVGGGPPDTDPPGGFARAPDHPARGVTDAPIVSAAAAEAVPGREASHGLALWPFYWVALGVGGLVFTLLGIGGLYILILTLQHAHEISP